MGAINSKIYRDIWSHKSRTLQVVMIIAIGAAALGLIVGTRNLVVPGMQNQWRSAHPAMINLFITPSISQDDLDVLRKEDGVVQVEGLGSTAIEWRTDPSEEWKAGGINFRADYNNQTLNHLEQVEGDWPSGNQASISQGDDSFFKIPKNGTVYIRFEDKEYTLHTRGVVYNMLQQPAYFGGTAQFFISQDEYERITDDPDFNQALITGVKYDEVQTAELADRVQKRIEKMGSDSTRFITDPNKHFFQDSLDGLFYLLGILGALALVLGLLLVYITINAIITQQVDQIGIMKAIGARTGQILRLYISGIFVYSFLAMLIAVPLGVFGAWSVSAWLISSFGSNPGPFQYSMEAVWTMLIIVYVAPMLAALIPIFNGARITVDGGYTINTRNS